MSTNRVFSALAAGATLLAAGLGVLIAVHFGAQSPAASLPSLAGGVSAPASPSGDPGMPSESQCGVFSAEYNQDVPQLQQAALSDPAGSLGMTAASFDRIYQSLEVFPDLPGTTLAGDARNVSVQAQSGDYAAVAAALRRFTADLPPVFAECGLTSS